MTRYERRRCLTLSFCFAVFMLRVMGQVEVWLLTPSWLPPFRAWESGLVPYPILLPIQILLIGWMSVILTDQWRGAGFYYVTRPTTRRRLRGFATIYFLTMLVRLIVAVAMPPHTLLERGIIPVIAHWNLAAFVALIAASPASCPSTAEPSKAVLLEDVT